MKYMTTLNNYMLGRFVNGTLRDMIMTTITVDKSHTRVILEIPNEHLNYVKKLLGADKYPKRLVELTQYEDRVHKQDEVYITRLEDICKLLKGKRQIGMWRNKNET